MTGRGLILVLLGAAPLVACSGSPPGSGGSGGGAGGGSAGNPGVAGGGGIAGSAGVGGSAGGRGGEIGDAAAGHDGGDGRGGDGGELSDATVGDDARTDGSTDVSVDAPADTSADVVGDAAGDAVARDAGGDGRAEAGTVDPGTMGDGDFTVGPTYTGQPELGDRGNPKGRSFNFTLDSASSTIFRGLDTTLTSPRTFTRRIDVYVPAQYRDGTGAPVLVIQDGPGDLALVRNALDNLTISTDPGRKLPAFVVVAVQNGGGDSKGSERGLEYDTLSDRYARFIHEEVLPAVAARPDLRAAYPGFRFTDDPEGRATLGCSSGGAAALTMGWFRPELFRRIITYSGTFVDQQDDDAPEEAMYRLGAWEYHSGQELILGAAPKPLRIFLNVNDRDLGASDPESTHHNWVMANDRTAADLRAKGYHYRYVRGQNAAHCDANVRRATLADALVWAWRGYSPP